MNTDRPGANLGIAVVGAGVVGICTALRLQRDGHRVTLVERGEPGRGASFGNAGLLQIAAVAPVATPGVVRKVPAMLLDPLGPLAIRWRHLPRLAPYLVRFLAAARPKEVERISIALAALLGPALEDWRTLIAEAGADDLVRHRGELHVYEVEANFAAQRPLFELRRRRGFPVEELGRDEIRQLEPALGPTVRRAYYLPEVRHLLDPFAVLGRLIAQFKAAGGEIVQDEVRGLELAEGRVRALQTGSGRRAIDGVVIAAGAHSKALARRLGARVPLDTERGYHMMLPNPGIELRTPFISGDRRFAVTPMAGGIRLAGTAELASVDAPPDYARARILVPLAQRLLPGLDASGGNEWMGRRPSLPDSLPVIGPAPRAVNAWLAFGHGHLGLTLAAVTGRLIADLVAGRPAPIDLTPYRAERF